MASQVWGNELVKRFNYPTRTAIVADSYLGVFPGDVEGKIIYDMGICSLSFLSADFKVVCLAKNASTANFVTSAMASQPNLPYLFIQSRYDRVQVKYYNFLAEQHGFAEIDGAVFEALADDVLQYYNSYPNFIAYFIDSNQHCYTPTPYMYFADTSGLNGYATDDDEMGGGRDDDGNINIDLYAETMNRWLTRIPLSPGDSISSQCEDEDCNTYRFVPKYFIQPALARGGGGSGEYLSGAVHYDPSNRVRNMHKLPHFDSKMRRVDNEFNVSVTSDPWNHTYTQSLIPFPIIIYLLGIFFVVIFQCYLICRRTMGYNPYAKAYTVDDEESDSIAHDDKMYLNRKNVEVQAPTLKMIFFKGLLWAALLCNFLIFVGNGNLNMGTEVADSAVGRIEESLATATGVSGELSVWGSNITTIFDEMSDLGCDDAALLAEYSTEFETVVEQFSDIMKPIEPYVRKSNNVLDTWVKERKNHFIWVTFSVNTLCIVLFAWSFSIKSSLGLQVTILLTEIIVILDMIFGMLYMISLVGAIYFGVTVITII